MDCRVQARFVFKGNSPAIKQLIPGGCFCVFLDFCYTLKITSDLIFSEKPF